MSTLATLTGTISVYQQTHFVALWVRVERWAGVAIVELLALGEFCECKLTQ